MATAAEAFQRLSAKLFNTSSRSPDIERSGAIGNAIISAQRKASVYNSSSIAVDPLRKVKVKPTKTLGSGWFNLQPLEMDSKLKNDIQMIRMRNYMDPKRFYKNPDKITSVLHVGTVIEGPSEYKSSRLTNKERRQSIVDEVLSDQLVKNYTKSKFMDIQQHKTSKQKMFRKTREDRKRAKKAKKISKLF